VYYRLNLKNEAKIKSATFTKESPEMLERRSFDMVILTMRIDGMSLFELAQSIKDIKPSIIL
jgi:DNA-binding NtrC family response regulator